jgi:macrolide-specific efflux system membrane fusion protein
MNRSGATVSILCLAITALARGDDPVAKPRSDGRLQLDSVVLTLIEQVEVSARQTGVLDSVAATEGQTVKEGDLLASLENNEQRLAVDKARIEAEIAAKQAASDVKIRYARKSFDVASAEEKRAVESAEKFSKSVSQTELDELRLTKERASLETEQATEDRDVARLTADLKRNALDTAKYNLSRCEIRSPLIGVVVQIKRRRGEWVQPGDVVMRIVRTDRLRVEAFLNSHDVGGDLMGRPVILSVDLPGQTHSQFRGSIVYVSPEVNPVNGQFRVWAQIDNRDGRLRPGLQGSMTIEPSATP